MNTKDFVYRLLDAGKQLVKNDPHPEFRPEVAVLSSLMDFPCDFKNGKCADKLRSPKCCCANCAYSMGHFGRTWPNDLFTLDKYAKMFTVKNGFWRPGKGCILHRHMRSLTCAFYVCYGISKKFDKRNDQTMGRLREVVGRYTACSYRFGGRSGAHHKEVVKTEKELTKAVAEIMLEKKLYFDLSNKELVIMAKPATMVSHFSARVVLQRSQP